MDVFLYSYKCKRWYGNVEGLRDLYVDREMSEQETIDKSLKDAKQHTGSETCNTQLLVKYQMIIDSVKTYPNISKIPSSVNL